MKALKIIKSIGYFSLLLGSAFNFVNSITEKTIFPPYVAFPFLVIAIVGIVCDIVLLVKNRKTKVKASDAAREKEDAELNREPEIVKLHAEVTDMVCSVRQVGTKMPRTLKEFLVCFRDDNGEIHKIYVDEEMYSGFEVGQTGELTLVDGILSTYELDE